jgi:hypothetical protein
LDGGREGGLGLDRYLLRSQHSHHRLADAPGIKPNASEAFSFFDINIDIFWPWKLQWPIR